MPRPGVHIPAHVMAGGVDAADLHDVGQERVEAGRGERPITRHKNPVRTSSDIVRIRGPCLCLSFLESQAICLDIVFSSPADHLVWIGGLKRQQPAFAVRHRQVLEVERKMRFIPVERGRMAGNAERRQQRAYLFRRADKTRDLAAPQHIDGSGGIGSGKVGHHHPRAPDCQDAADRTLPFGDPYRRGIVVITVKAEPREVRQGKHRPLDPRAKKAADGWQVGATCTPHCQSPRCACQSVSAARAAVSARRMRGPSTAG